MRPQYELADIVRTHLAQWEVSGQFNNYEISALRDIASCRTADLGGHVNQCSHCGHQHISYNSCRNSNCPKCGATKRLRWLMQRREDLPDIRFFHTVFTVPDTLNPLFLKFPKPMYNLLFQSAWASIQTFAADHKYLGAQSGMIAVLHTWGQNLSLHPHVHCMIPEGGLTQQNNWRVAKKIKSKYLFPVEAVSVVFRGIFCKGLIQLHNQREITMQNPMDAKNKSRHELYRTKWVVFSKAPFAGGSNDQLLVYLSNYINRVAFANHRIKDITENQIKFTYKNYRNSTTGVMQLTHTEFIRRFLQHLLPKGFRRVRHYGIFSCHNKKRCRVMINLSIGKCRAPQALPQLWHQLWQKHTGRNPLLCPKCKLGQMVIVSELKPIRGSPENWSL